MPYVTTFFCGRGTRLWWAWPGGKRWASRDCKHKTALQADDTLVERDCRRAWEYGLEEKVACYLHVYQCTL
eukprot:1158968-Pelagomonas_calceolata.AAC.4